MSSRHEGISCDACMKSSFKLRRYKCLVCYDYDLCGSCYDSNRETNNHSVNHPMQCILTAGDYDTFYFGEDGKADAAEGSYTCPFCGRLGLSKTTLLSHVSQQHPNSTGQVICPVCASQQDGNANRHTFQFLRHLEKTHCRDSRESGGSQQRSTSRPVPVPIPGGTRSSTSAARESRASSSANGVHYPDDDATFLNNHPSMLYSSIVSGIGRGATSSGTTAGGPIAFSGSHLRQLRRGRPNPISSAGVTATNSSRLASEERSRAASLISATGRTSGRNVSTFMGDAVTSANNSNNASASMAYNSSTATTAMSRRVNRNLSSFAAVLAGADVNTSSSDSLASFLSQVRSRGALTSQLESQLAQSRAQLERFQSYAQSQLASQTPLQDSSSRRYTLDHLIQLTGAGTTSDSRTSSLHQQQLLSNLQLMADMDINLDENEPFMDNDDDEDLDDGEGGGLGGVNDEDDDAEEGCAWSVEDALMAAAMSEGGTRGSVWRQYRQDQQSHRYSHQQQAASRRVAADVPAEPEVPIKATEGITGSQSSSSTHLPFMPKLIGELVEPGGHLGEEDSYNRAKFVQELLIASLLDQVSLNDLSSADDIDSI